MAIILENEKATLQFNQDTNSLELIWKKVADEFTYKLMFTTGIEYFKRSDATGWMSDIRKEGVVSPNLSKWMQEEILPQALANGLKKIAVVMDTDIFKEFYVKNIEQNSGLEFMQYFDCDMKAQEWLKN